MIETERLVLIPATLESLRAEAAHEYAEFARIVGAATPETWPPDLYDDDAIFWSLRSLEDGVKPPWTTHYFALKGAPRVLVGAGGIVRAPLAGEGCVELGYTILAAHRRQGYASEATAGLVACAFQAPGIERVLAHTYPALAASIRVLEKNGFRLEGPGAGEGTVRYARER